MFTQAEIEDQGGGRVPRGRGRTSPEWRLGSLGRVKAKSGFEQETVALLWLVPDEINLGGFMLLTATSSAVDGSSTGVTLCSGRYVCLLLCVSYIFISM